MALASSLVAVPADVCAKAPRRAARGRWRVGAAVVGGMLLAGCQSIDMTPQNVAQVRVIAASPDAGSMDFYAGNTALAYGVDFGSASSYMPLAAGTVRLSANTANSTQMLVASNAGLS